MTDSKRISKLLNKKKIHGEVKDHYSCEMRWPLIGFCVDEHYSYVSSPKFTLCGSQWTLSIFPTGVYETNDYLSIFLVSHSKEDVYASYTLSIKNQASEGPNFSWSDPEGIVKFSASDDGDNQWGNEEFILIDDASDNLNYTGGGKITFEVAIEVFGREDLNRETLSKEAQDAVETKDLIKLADEDLYQLVKKLPKCKNSVAQKKQEDGIVKKRGEAPPVPVDSRAQWM